jgi:hypothetical protein
MVVKAVAAVQLLRVELAELLQQTRVDLVEMDINILNLL